MLLLQRLQKSQIELLEIAYWKIVIAARAGDKCFCMAGERASLQSASSYLAPAHIPARPLPPKPHLAQQT